MLTEAILHAKKLITHANCMDGLATAMIVRDCMPGIPVEFVQYNTPEYKALKPEEGVIFCDIVPAQNAPNEVAAWIEAGAVMLDHHKENRLIVEAAGELGVFADEKRQPGWSGAVLAFLEVWQRVEATGVGNTPAQLVAAFARLAGVRDTWQQQRINQASGLVELNPDWMPALCLHEVLANFPATYWLGVENFEGHGPIPGAGIVKAMDGLLLGRLLLEDKERRVSRAMQHGLIAQQVREDHVWTLSAEPYTLVSDLADAARAGGGNVLVNIHNGVQGGQLRHIVSLRSDGSVDVGALAKKHGGGGHSRAAGFSEPQILSAADLFRTLILESEAELLAKQAN